MAIRRFCVALLLSSLPAAGCGTVANLACTPFEEGGKAPFGGVERDMACIRKAANGEFALRPHAESEPVQHPQVAPMLACAADLPLSLIGDVVTWPYAAGYTFINSPVPVPPITVAPPRSPQLPAPEKAPADKTDSLPKLPAPRKVEPIVPQPGLLLLPTIATDGAGRTEAK